MIFLCRRSAPSRSVNFAGRPVSWSWVILEKLIVVDVFKKFQAFCPTRMFITVFTRARHRCLNQINQSTPYPICLSSVLITFNVCPCLPSCRLPSGSPTKILYSLTFSHVHATWLPHLMHPDLVIEIKSGVIKLRVVQFSRASCYSLNKVCIYE
jgi:hypothetical protein